MANFWSQISYFLNSSAVKFNLDDGRSIHTDCLETYIKNIS